MLRTTQDILELRRWAEAHGARPCREEASGRLVLSISGGEGGLVCDIGWDEFEPAFLTTHEVFVYDDSPGCIRCFVGTEADARAFVRAECYELEGGDASPAP